MAADAFYKKNYLQGLDGVRALAALFVVVGHCLEIVPRCIFGVDVFFVLSGFLITRLLLQEHAETGQISLKYFYIRRAFRILPPVLILLLLDGLLRPFYAVPPNFN